MKLHVVYNATDFSSVRKICVIFAFCTVYIYFIVFVCVNVKIDKGIPSSVM